MTDLNIKKIDLTKQSKTSSVNTEQPKAQSSSIFPQAKEEHKDKKAISSKVLNLAESYEKQIKREMEHNKKETGILGMFLGANKQTKAYEEQLKEINELKKSGLNDKNTITALNNINKNGTNRVVEAAQALQKNAQTGAKVAGATLVASSVAASVIAAPAVVGAAGMTGGAATALGSVSTAATVGGMNVLGQLATKGKVDSKELIQTTTSAAILGPVLGKFSGGITKEAVTLLAKNTTLSAAALIGGGVVADQGPSGFYSKEIRPIIQSDLISRLGFEGGSDRIKAPNGKEVKDIEELLTEMKPDIESIYERHDKLPKGLLEFNMRMEYGQSLLAKDFKGTLGGLVGPLTAKHLKNDFHNALDVMFSPATELVTNKRFHEALGKTDGPSMSVVNIKPEKNLMPGVIQNVKDEKIQQELINAYKDHGEITPNDMYNITGNSRDLKATTEILAALFTTYQPIAEAIKKLPEDEQKLIVSQDKRIPDQVRPYQNMYWQGHQEVINKLKQLELYKKGLISDKDIDGYIGPTSEKAIKEYEQKYGELKPVIDLPDSLTPDKQQEILNKLIK